MPTMTYSALVLFRSAALLASIATLLAAPPALAETGTRADAKKQGPPAPQPGRAPSRFRPERFAGRAGRYYRAVWGIDALTVKLVESGELVRFSYRVVDPERARALADKANEPSLLAPRAGVRLAVPTMEKIGQLRQAGAPEEGKAYWIAFSNKGRPVRRGDRVDVIIGQFRAQGLVVD